LRRFIWGSLYTSWLSNNQAN